MSQRTQCGNYCVYISTLVRMLIWCQIVNTTIFSDDIIDSSQCLPFIMIGNTALLLRVCSTPRLSTHHFIKCSQQLHDEVLFLFVILQMGNWGTEMLQNLPEVSRLMSCGAVIGCRSKSQRLHHYVTMFPPSCFCRSFVLFWVGAGSTLKLHCWQNP